MKKIELLAPAGNMESLKAAVAAGCDAVYLGLTNFSARAFAGNFDREQFCEAIRYCHDREVKIYVTMNTMLYEKEIENAKETVKFLYDNDTDALLIQDLGLFHIVQTMFPDFEVHCSTQMHIHNLNGVRFMQSLGVSRVVMARETPIEVIREACKTGMEIEVFSYGAICISYSGQCLMSASIKNRSANRGMCAQCCRLRYYPDHGGHFKDGDYILSPKDLNVIDRIPELIQAGVSSLKIEGRMKRPEYVWIVVKTFREAIDAYYEGKAYTVDAKRQKELLLMFNRLFSQGHLFHDDVEGRMSHYRANHRGIKIGTVQSFSKGLVTVQLCDSLHQHDGLRILNEPYDTGLTAVKIFKNGKLVSSAESGDIVQLECKSKPFPKKGQSLQKTSDSVLIDEIDRRCEAEKRSVPIKVEYNAIPGHVLEVTLRDERGNVVYACGNQPLEEPRNAPVTRERLEEALSKTGEYPYRVETIIGRCGNVFIPVSAMNEVRRNAMDRLSKCRMFTHVRRGMKEYTCTLEKPMDPEWKILVYDRGRGNHIPEVHVVTNENGMCPTVSENLDEPVHLQEAILSEAGDFYGSLDKCIAGMTLNIANSYALAFVLMQKGVCGAIFSSECSEEQIHETLHAFEERYGFTPFTYRLVYGKRTLMTIKDLFSSEKPHGIKDYHGQNFMVAYNEYCTEIFEENVYVSSNTICKGSYLITDDTTDNLRSVEEEAYEEIYGRI